MSAGPQKASFDTDGRTVWINGPDTCLGRFSKFGIDVHRSLADQIAGHGQCAYCTHVKPNTYDWHLFTLAMQKWHAINVPPNLRPSWLADQ